MNLASFIADPHAVVQSFDAWHLAMEGPEAHEIMRGRRLDVIVERQIQEAAGAGFCDVGGRVIHGPLTIEHDGDGRAL